MSGPMSLSGGGSRRATTYSTNKTGCKGSGQELQRRWRRGPRVGQHSGLVTAVPYRFEPTDSVAAVRARHPEVAPDEATGDQVTVAGRLMLRRGQGKLAFGQLTDW